MTNSLFIRTYSKDLPWLHELFRSIDKFVTGFEIIVQCDTIDRKAVEGVVKGRAEVKSRAPYHEAGYMSQQLAKTMADTYCSGQYITFCDSDCLFIDHTTPDHFFADGKPQMLYTSYAALNGSTPWQPITERIMGCPVEHEYMRTIRLTYPREIFAGFRGYIEKRHGVKNALAWIGSVGQYSEFNALGAHCWMFEHDKFSWVNTEDGWLPKHNIRQYWSHGSITPEIRSEIERYLS